MTVTYRLMCSDEQCENGFIGDETMDALIDRAAAEGWRRRPVVGAADEVLCPDHVHRNRCIHDLDAAGNCRHSCGYNSDTARSGLVRALRTPGTVIDRDALNEIIHDTFRSIYELNGTKGNEYASDADALANFKRRGAELELTPLKVWGIFAGKHWDAVLAYIRRGRTLSEPIDSRIDDLVLYLILLKGLIEETTPAPAAAGEAA